MKEDICQSCGMPLGDSDHGTNSDGNMNPEYCKYCFQKGRFTDHGISMEGKIAKNVELAMKMGMPVTKAKELAENTIPKLKRWRR
jgi:hypothetical protein